MADVNISKYRASVVRDGSKPASPGFVVSEGQDPVNPPGTNNYVPYTGATANVELGEFGLETGFVTLDTTPTNVPTEQGAIYWDDSRSTAALIMNGTLQHIGQDTFFYVKNSSAYTIPKGTCVRFAGTDGASGHLLILPFTANGAFPSSYFMGVTAEDIANGEFGQVMHFGELTGIDTTGYTAGALLYASSTVAGAFQTTAPVAPNNIVLVAAAVNSKVNGAIVVRPTLGSNFGTNESVKLTSVTDKDLLQYTVTAGIGVWENKTLSQVIGSAYVPNTRTITINGVTQDLSANRTFNVGTVTSVTATSPLFSSGGATPNITIQQASGSQSGFLSSTDWTTFNNKQNALTNPVTGTGTTNYLPKFTGNTTIGNSALQETNGNLGLGVTPSAWGSSAYGGTTRVLELGELGSSIGAGAGALIIGNNWYSTNSAAIYSRTGFGATYYAQNTASGQHQWWLAPSGTAGNTITFTQAMTLTNVGNLLVGTTSDAGQRLQVSGSIYLLTGGNRNIRIGSATNYYYDLQSTNDDFQIIEAGSTPRLTIKYPNGNVGIGTTNPLTKLMVQDSANTYVAHFSGLNQANGIAIGTNSSNVAVIQGYTRTFSATNNISMQADGGNLLVGTSSDNGAKLQVSGGGTFGSSVGINTTSPSAPLHIVTPTGVNFQNAIRFEKAGGFGEVNLENYYTSGSNYGFGIDVAGTTMMVVNNLGNVGIGTASPSQALDVYRDSSVASYVVARNGSGVQTAIGVAGDNGSLLGTLSNHNLRIVTNGAVVSTITNGGNVLIGTTTDNGAKLNVNGTIRTANPTGSTSDGWLLGRALVSGSSTPDRWIRVQIGNLYYDILARYIGSV